LIVIAILCLLGSDVAQYAAVRFPEFLKTVSAYNEGSLATALENAFLGFDATLVTEDVKKELKILAASGDKTGEEDVDDEESMLICFVALATPGRVLFSVVCVGHRQKNTLFSSYRQPFG